MRATFAVGRVQGADRRVLWLARADARVFPGPWRVRAVVADHATDVVPSPAGEDHVSPTGSRPRREAAAGPDGQFTLL